ncbi:MAG: lipopolysaccharide transport periplasmic protein LptA [Undibacterium sp.]|nr:lipopolysaccharide transport periplasmic protein LptA [Undibacterium sp.]
MPKHHPFLSFFHIAAYLCASAFLGQSAYAEKADSQKKATIDAGFSLIQDSGKSGSLKHNVIVTKGTLLIQAQEANYLRDKDDNLTVVLSRGSNGPVSFRQKRDGGTNLWVEGYADKVEYDEKTEVVKFISKAMVRYLDDQTETHRQDADFFSYDSSNNTYTATNSSSGKHVPGAGRVTMTLPPKQNKAELKPSATPEPKPTNKLDNKQEPQ